jgi:hypothetical protein
VEITVKARFNAANQRIEKYGQEQYIAYLTFPEDRHALEVLRIVLSRYLGIPLRRVQFKCRNVMQDYVFVLS